MNTPASLRNPITTWENVLWKPEPLFQGQTVFCLASGPSLTAEICEKVRGRPTIAVNSSCKLAPWADVLFFTDSGWFEKNRAVVANWPGLVVTLSRKAKRELDDPSVNLTGKPRVNRIRCVGVPEFPPYRAGLPRRYAFPPPGEVQQGRSSGHTAIALAIAMGANRVAMLGYDMRFVAGREHFHSEYPHPRDPGLYESSFVPCFKGWNESARGSGVEIVNCTPGSAVEEFPFADLDAVLAEG